MIAIRLRKDLERLWYGLRRRGDLDVLSERSDLSERCDFSERVIGRSGQLWDFHFFPSLNHIQNRVFFGFFIGVVKNDRNKT